MDSKEKSGQGQQEDASDTGETDSGSGTGKDSSGKSQSQMEQGPGSSENPDKENNLIHLMLQTDSGGKDSVGQSAPSGDW